jgi:hypothetical protein
MVLSFVLICGLFQGPLILWAKGITRQVVFFKTRLSNGSGSIAKGNVQKDEAAEGAREPGWQRQSTGYAQPPRSASAQYGTLAGRFAGLLIIESQSRRLLPM